MTLGTRRLPPAGWNAPRADWAYRVSRGIVWSVLTGFVQRRVHGFEHIAAVRRRGGAFVLAPNHVSHFDGPILTMTLPGVIDWLGAAEFFLPGGLGAWLRHTGGIPVLGGAGVLGTVREALRRLRRGRALGVFPEGGLRSGEASVLAGAPITRGGGVAGGACKRFRGAVRNPRFRPTLRGEKLASVASPRAGVDRFRSGDPPGRMGGGVVRFARGTSAVVVRRDPGRVSSGAGRSADDRRPTQRKKMISEQAARSGARVACRFS